MGACNRRMGSVANVTRGLRVRNSIRMGSHRRFRFFEYDARSRTPENIRDVKDIAPDSS